MKSCFHIYCATNPLNTGTIQVKRLLLRWFHKHHPLENSEDDGEDSPTSYENLWTCFHLWCAISPPTQKKKGHYRGELTTKAMGLWNCSPHKSYPWKTMTTQVKFRKLPHHPSKKKNTRVKKPMLVAWATWLYLARLLTVIMLVISI